MTNAAAPAVQHAPALGPNKGIKFQISTKGNKWNCVLQDRGDYERTKAAHAEGPSTEPAEPTEAAAESTGSSTSSSSASTKST